MPANSEVSVIRNQYQIWSLHKESEKKHDEPFIHLQKVYKQVSTLEPNDNAAEDDGQEELLPVGFTKKGIITKVKPRKSQKSAKKKHRLIYTYKNPEPPKAGKHH